LKYFYEYEDINSRNVLICAINNNEILGSACLEIYKDSKFGNYYGLKWVSVKKEYQGLGIGTAISEYLFKFLKNKNMSVSFSQFTDESLRKLKYLFINLQNIGRNLEDL